MIEKTEKDSGEVCGGRIYSICQDTGCRDLREKESKALRSLEPGGQIQKRS